MTRPGLIIQDKMQWILIILKRVRIIGFLLDKHCFKIFIMALNIPQLILQFIENPTETGTMLLPFHYPQKDEWEEFQSGFRYHGLSGKDLTSTGEGGWQPGWHVIARNGMDDPFFIDLNEEASGFPVYYAQHGAGRWDAIALGFNIASLGRFLEQMEKAGTDKTACLQLVEIDLRNTNLTNALMKNCLVESAMFEGALTTGFKFIENYYYGATLGQKDFDEKLCKADSFNGL